MRIAYCIRGTFNSGGMERVLANKTRWLVNHGYDVTIITTDQQGRSSFFDFAPQIRHIDLGVNYFPIVHKRGWIRQQIKRVKDCLNHGRRLRALLKKERFDVVVSMFNEEVQWLPRINDGSRKVVEIHFSKQWRIFFSEAKRLTKRLGARRRTWGDARSVRRYDRFVALTEEDRANWRRVDARVIYNATSFLPPQTAALDNKRVVALGRLDGQKRFDRLVEAWVTVHAKHPDWHLSIYGDGWMRDDLMKQAAAAGLSQTVSIENATSDVPSVLLGSSIYAMSSRFEGFPMVLMEAMACGVPCVAMACQCGPRDAITHGVNGLLVDEGDIQGLAAGICRLIEDEPMRKRLGTAARAAVEECFTEEKIMRQWDELFKELGVRS